METTIIGLIREEKKPSDNRVALTPAQCKWLLKSSINLKIIAQPSSQRCFKDEEYERAGVIISENLNDCKILFGIKEVPFDKLIPEKTYLFFSHTKKKQAHNQRMFKEIIRKKINLIDYECLEHEDGTRIIGFGFFAGIVGAHNGIMSYGNRTGLFHLERVYKQKSFRELIHSYFGLKLPNIKVIVTGSGRVAHGVLEIMNLMGLHEVEPEEFLEREFDYPVYVQLKGGMLYAHENTHLYSRDDFHEHPQHYKSKFLPFARSGDILMNGVYWDHDIPKLFEEKDVHEPSFRICTISDITDDAHGSVPINLGDQSIEDPIYGVDRKTLQKTKPYQPNSIDVIAVGNLPNELPRDASRYFGEQLIKYILPDLFANGSKIIEDATIVKNGIITEKYAYLNDYGAD